jgi:hypothetical protein
MVDLGMAVPANQVALLQLWDQLLEWQMPGSADLKVFLGGVSVMKLQGGQALPISTASAPASEILDSLHLLYLLLDPGSSRQACPTDTALAVEVGYRLILTTCTSTGLQSIGADKLQLLAVPAAPWGADEAVLSGVQLLDLTVDLDRRWDEVGAVPTLPWGRFRGHSDKIAVPSNPAHR